jgi:hypothetical protein
MSRKKRTDEALDRVRQAAAQLQPAAAKVKPLAGSTGAAAKRSVYRTRAWAAPRVEHTGQVVEEGVAPKVSALLSSVAQLLEPDKPRHRRWRTPSGYRPQPQEAGLHDSGGQCGRRGTRRGDGRWAGENQHRR